MSLSSIIHDDPKIRKGLKARVVRPKIIFDRSVQAQPLTENYQIVGAAFDYLLRFFLQRVNGHAQASLWVAERGVELIDSPQYRMYDAHDESADGEVSPRYREAAAYLRDAKRRHQAYLKSGVVTDELLVAALRLARLDVAYRAGPDRVDWVGLKSPDPKDAKDLRTLLALAKKQPFKKLRLCALNPTFGAASTLVGGADADLVLDGCIIDIKTTKYPRLDPRDFYQLIGYYLLYGFDGIHFSDSKTTNHKINSLAIYFSRFGYLWKFSIDEVLPPDTLPDIAKWFFNSVCPSKAERIKRLGGFHGLLAKYLSESKKGAAKTSMPSSGRKHRVQTTASSVPPFTKTLASHLGLVHD